MTHYLIKEMLPEERPREKMLALGPQALTPRELLAITYAGRKHHGDGQ